VADIEQLRERLANIRTVQPILGALRTISLGGWQMALNRRAGLQRYTAQLQALLPLLLTELEQGAAGRRRRSAGVTMPAAARPVVVLALGTERGLCGRFNHAVADGVLAELEARGEAGVEVELVVLGLRLARLLARRGVRPAYAAPLSTSSLPSFAQARTLTRDWLERYEAYSLDAVDVIFNAYRSLGSYETVVRRLLPPEITPLTEISATPAPDEIVIVETDPWSLYARVVEQEILIRCYSFFLESVTAEHALRYQLMEGATQNAERLVEELTLELQALRRQAITREMQELAASAGLLKR